MKRLTSALNVMLVIAMLLFGPQAAVSAQGSRPDRGTPPAETQAVEQPESRTDRIIVKLRDVAEPASEEAQVQMAETLSARVGVPLRYVRTMDDYAQVMTLAERLPLDQVRGLVDQLRALPEVEYAEPDVVFRPALVPNDPRYGEQWHYSGPFGIDAPAAWNVTTGLATTVVAVVDTGITTHPDLSGRTVPGYDFIGDVLVANDGGGRDNNPSDPGDWITNAENNSGYFAGCAISNSSWHGTHVAGTIGANTNNGVGVAGINWKAKILPVRVLGKCGGYLSDISDGIRWAAGLSVSGVPANANPAKVINVSIGGPADTGTATGCSVTYQSAINGAVSAGATVVVAAGNEAQLARESQPGNCDNVITVAATADDSWRATYSNYGPVVEISAPGGDFAFDTAVLSTMNSGTTVPGSPTYAASQGTSMATPHVVGIVSLMLARNPWLTPAQILQTLKSTAKPFSSGSDCTGTTDCGAGIANAAAAVNATAPRSFFDVTTSYWAYSFIERLSNAGITGGCNVNPLRYCPEGTVNRAQMAVFLLRGIHGSSYTPPAVGATTGFTDVAPSYWAAAWIKQLAAEGITSGCGPAKFCPEGAVNRAQMAVFLLKAKHGSSYVPPPVGSSTGFGDVPTTHWAAPFIKQLVVEGITSGCGSGNYCPDGTVTRAQMAVFLVKTFSLP